MSKTKLTLEELTTEIRGLISQSAKAKIEIGELLIEHTDKIKHGDKEAFYDSIGMSERTAQYYMSIARNPEVKKLKKEGKLDGLNMSEILRLIGARVNVRGDNNEDAPQRQKYTPLGFGNFEFEKCRSTAQFKAEYRTLADEVTSLRAELETLKTKSA